MRLHERAEVSRAGQPPGKLIGQRIRIGAIEELVRQPLDAGAGYFAISQMWPPGSRSEAVRTSSTSIVS
ncbi:MAG: hypothetical protein ACRDG7_01455 [Candidatus Limnocylindria bacterium]